ncbi:MAG TPA: bifunctional rhamnulose-1-phosphate aldolase/short-chain dehydrogenase [Pirellulaceae bacterium]|nr:bifunctional rhamnulose-1-phosphate aldolase/short-chain dehydrogenase [Pirellulaceae bacterium]
MTTTTKTYQFVNHTWDEQRVAGLSEVELLVYRSNILGDDGRITNTGGGNTSSKIQHVDPLTGEWVTVLWVKGSGGDLRTSTVENFASLYMDKLYALQPKYAAAPDRGPKTSAEDAMVALYPHCTFNLNPRAASIDTPLHAFIPRTHVDHTHPNAVIAVAACRRAAELTRAIYGDEVVWTPWLRPGFELGLILEQIWQEHPEIKGVVLGQHGLINGANQQHECYEQSLELIERAAQYIDAHDRGEKTFGGQRYRALEPQQREALLTDLLPWLRGELSRQHRVIGTVQCDETMLRFVNSHDAPRLAELGTSCPDHFLRTKIKPLYIEWNPQQDNFEQLRDRLQLGLEHYRRDYAAYYQRCRRPDSPAMRGADPTVILIPGVGMIAWGKTKSESRVTAEFYNCAVEVMRGAEAIDEYIALPEQEAFDIEYWLLEEAKLKRMPPEKSLARRIVLVVGAGSGIGRQAAHRLAAEGAHVVCADLDVTAAEQTAHELTTRHGHGIGVAGSGISGCGPAIAVALDMTKRESIRAAIRQTLLAYGGLDHLVITAGIYVSPRSDGTIADEAWGLTYDVNVIGPYLVADEARKVWQAQGLTGSMVLTTSVNGMVAKKGSLAYDSSKAAANHLVRELAVELAPQIRVNAVAPATVVSGSSMFPRDRVIASLSKYGISFEPSDTTDALRDRLAQFYAERTLLKLPIQPADQADAILFLMGDASAKTTGQLIAVDGGLPDAFVR